MTTKTATIQEVAYSLKGGPMVFIVGLTLDGTRRLTAVMLTSDFKSMPHPPKVGEEWEFAPVPANGGEWSLDFWLGTGADD